MTEFAQFVALADDAFTLPLTPSPTTDFERGPFPLADLDRSRTAVLAFRVRAHGTPRLQMTLNQQSVVSYEFDPPEPESTRPRSWHEVVPGNILDPQVNFFVAAVTGSGSIDLSDIVLFYHASTGGPQRTL